MNCKNCQNTQSGVIKVHDVYNPICVDCGRYLTETNKRERLKIALNDYVNYYWYKGALNGIDEDQLERFLSGIMAFVAVEMWDKPFTPFMPPVLVEEEEEDKK